MIILSPSRIGVVLCLAVGASHGAADSSASVENTGDGKLKTATFRVDDLAAARAFPGQMDFRLAVEGPGDLTCAMVRIVKPDWKETRP